MPTHSYFSIYILFGRLRKVSNLNLQTKCFGTTHNISTIGFIGLGAMGSRMAQNLIKQYKMLVYDLNEAATTSLAGKGATVASGVEDLAAADCIVSMLPASQHVMDVYCGPNGLISQVSQDTLLIDSSTVDPEVAQTLAAEAQQRNITFMDAPVSGGILAAAAGQLTFMVGGSKEGLGRAEPLLQSMGRKIIHCGPNGSGQTAKICNNMLLAVSMVATAEAMNLGIRLGLDPKLLACVINTSTGRCWSSDTYNPVPGVLDNVPASNNYQGGFMSHLLMKDLTLVNAVAERSGAAIPFGEQALHIYQALCQQGKANLDFSVVYQYIKDKGSK